MEQMTNEKWRKDKDVKREKFMTKDEMAEVNQYIADLNNRVGDMGTLFAEWNEIEEYYANRQEDKVGKPNSKINIINANVEGQVSQLIEQNIAITTRGEGPSDEPFADWARIGLDWMLRKNHIKRVLDVHERRRLKFGVGAFSVSWDSEALNKFGLAKIHPTPLNMLFVDGSTKDPLRFQESSYICEIVYVSKHYFTERYGKDKAEAVDYGSLIYRDNGVFQGATTIDDEYTAPLILRWSRHKGKLRLQEISGCGVLLYDSHKEGKRTDNQKSAKFDHKSYHKYVNDKYPYFFTVMYPEEGKLYGFGDGKLLLPLQKLINELYDKIRICARPNIVLFDINTEVDLSDFDENSLEPRPYDGAQSQNPVVSQPWGQVNRDWFNLLDRIHQEAQRVTRFSDLMIGQNKASDTATEAAIQQQQGTASTDHKKLMLQETLVEVCEYCLGLMMENYTEAKAFRISEDKPEYEWIDFRQMSRVPAMQPATESHRKQFRELNPNAQPPQWEIMQSGGKNMEKVVDFDIEINIGAGLPKNKAFLWQMIERLSQVTAIDTQTGAPTPVMNLQELRKFIEDFLGIPLENDQQLMGMMQQPMPGQMQPGQMQGQMQNPNAPLSMNGNPMLGGMMGANQGPQPTY